MKKMKCQFAIKYEVIKLDDTEFMLKPKCLLKGEETEDGFKCENGKEYPIFLDALDGRRKYYADMIYADDELSFIFDYDGDDEDFIGNYFFENYKKTMMFVDTTDVNEAGIPYRNLINLKMLSEEEDTKIYYMDDSIPNVVLNEKAVRKMMDCKSLKKVKLMLAKYQNNLESIKKHNETDGVTRISITGNTVNYYETTKDVDFEELEKVRAGKKDISSNSGTINNSDISYQGLRDYIKERIYGHDSEVDTFAQKLYMNYTAEKGESVDSILFVGPTGTGKTKTVEYACEYLDIPCTEANASNLVTQGIVGTSIEDVIIGLYEKANCDIEKAQRGLIFLDEFDKLSDTNLDTKAPVKNILLTFTAGGKFPISTNHYNFIFDSFMTNKVFAGVFERISVKQNPMGFGAVKKIAPTLGTDLEIRKKIIDKKYFTQEELTRISTILAYNDISREKKKDALLHAKSSEYVKKRDRLLRQFGIDLVLEEECIDAVLDKLTDDATGMRSLNNFFKKTLDVAERSILEGHIGDNKKLVLTRKTVENPNDFEIMKK